MLSLMHPLFIALADNAPAVSAAPGPDPTLTIIASAFGGAVLTGLTTLIVNWRSGVRERKKWELEARYNVYTEYLERIARDTREMRSRVLDALPKGRHNGDLEKDLLGTQLLAAPELVLAIRTREHTYSKLVSAIATAALHVSENGCQGKSPEELAEEVWEDHVGLAQDLAESTAEVVWTMRRELGTSRDPFFWQKRKRIRELMRQFWESVGGDPGEKASTEQHQRP